MRALPWNLVSIPHILTKSKLRETCRSDRIRHVLQQKSELVEVISHVHEMKGTAAQQLILSYN